MTVALQREREWTADEFVQTDQHDFGNLWRYELVDGRVIGHAAPHPEHGAIAAGLTAAIAKALAGKGSDCRPEMGSAATPVTKQRNTARIPDVTIRCGEHPRVLFEVISPSEVRNWRGRDRKRRDLQQVEGVAEIIELFQDDYAAHVYRLMPGNPAAWTFEAVGGADASITLASAGLELPLTEIYAFARLPASDDE